jgi:Uma2 family endonuclease
MNLHQPTKMSIEQFGAWLQRQERKHELVRGIPRMLPWVKRNHNRVAINLVRELSQQLDPDRFEIASGELAVRTGEDSIRYPDVMVERAGAPGEERYTKEPVLLFEILSSSTMHTDFGDKRHEYQALESLRAYVILAQNEPRIWLWQRGDDGAWPADPEQLAEGSLKLPAVGVELDIAAIYRGVRP